MTQPRQRQPGRHSADPSASEADDAGAEVEARDVDRVITFDDAVVAIAITLLALDLPVPHGDLSNGQFLHALGHNWNSYLAFVLSFWVITNHWASHRKIFRYVSRLNSRVFVLNMIWLLMVVLLPFATKLVTVGGALGARFTIYALIQIIAVGSAMLMSMEKQVSRLVRRNTPDHARQADLLRPVSIILAFLISIPVAYVAGSWAFALWALSPLIGYAIRRFTADRRLTVCGTRDAKDSG